MAHVRPRVRILSVTEFRERFGSAEQCEAHLARARWPEGFYCFHCQGSRGSHLQRRGVYQCLDCRRQTSLTAGTIFHGSRVSLDRWYWAIYRLAQDKKGCSAMLLSKEIDVSYPTAWLMAHKIRQAMNKNNQPFMLQGVVELDDACLGGMRQGISGRPREGDPKLTPLLAAVEVLPDGKPGRAALRPVRSFRMPWINEFVGHCLSPRCVIHTDEMKSFRDLSRLGHIHEVHLRGAYPKRARKRLPKVHMLISNLKRFVLGRHHAIRGKHAERYLGEFNFRFNHRHEEATLFETLVQVCAEAQAMTYAKLTTAVRT
jgi:transposase-like protein